MVSPFYRLLLSLPSNELVSFRHRVSATTLDYKAGPAALDLRCLAHDSQLPSLFGRIHQRWQPDSLRLLTQFSHPDENFRKWKRGPWPLLLLPGNNILKLLFNDLPFSVSASNRAHSGRSQSKRSQRHVSHRACASPPVDSRTLVVLFLCSILLPNSLAPRLNVQHWLFFLTKPLEVVGDYIEDERMAWYESHDVEISEPAMMDVDVDTHPSESDEHAPPAKDRPRVFSIFAAPSTVSSSKRKLSDTDEPEITSRPPKIARIEACTEQPPKSKAKAKGKDKSKAKAKGKEKSKSKPKGVILHPVGTSKTAKWEHKNNARYEAGNLEDEATSMARFKNSLLVYDEFMEVVDSMNVRHSACGKVLIMKTGYNTGNFKTHVQQRCKGPTRTGKVAGAGGHPTLAGMFKKLAKEDSVASQTSKPAPSTNRQLAIASSSKSRPCMGLSSAEEPLHTGKNKILI
ncbi:hypothetical protein R3P38DRAFT_3181887 [Favolaschia claudopus]|uniref:Uncharacterized protein n=1 Tax=Favolaschia claudopus TaxID=2862362 RepID=A0AAW0CKJ2_9AGAR